MKWPLFCAGLILAVVVAGILLPQVTRRERVVVGIESFQELYLFVDGNGDVLAQGTLRIPASKLSDYLNYLISMLGEDLIERDYKEGMTKSLTMFGFESENMKVDVVAGENLEVKFEWWSPKVARWDGENWELRLDWVDAISAAEETIAEEEVSMVLMGSIAGRGSVVEYTSSSLMFIVLPENAENVWADVPWVSGFTDYGGGSYSLSRVALGEYSGRAAVVDNTVVFLTNTGQLTITPENMAENFLAYTVRYSGVVPSENSFLGSLEPLRLDLKYGRELRSAYPVFVGGKVYQMTPAQILLLVAKGLRSGNLSEISPLEIENVAPPRSEAGEWTASLKVLDRKGYLRLADGVVEHFSLTGRAPDNLLLDGAVVRFRDILYTLLRVARDSRDGAMPENLLILPVPSGTLMRENSDVPAKYSYYLLSDAYVKTGTEKVREVLDNFLENLSLRSLAEEICNWTGSNITYRFFPLPPTSEETLKERKGQCRDFTNVYLALARTVGLPARRMLGWVTSTWQPPAGWGFISTTTPEGKTIALHAWVEVFIPGEGWLPLEPQSHRPALYFGDLPYEVYRRLPQSWMGAMAGYESAAGRI